MANKHVGSTFDDFLEKEDLYAEAKAVAIKRVLAHQIETWMEERHISKSEMARKMETSRSALDRLLDPENTAITLHTLARAATVVGKKLDIHLE